VEVRLTDDRQEADGALKNFYEPNDLSSATIGEGEQD